VTEGAGVAMVGVVETMVESAGVVEAIGGSEVGGGMVLSGGGEAYKTIGVVHR
jgi:hypothetical protein